MTPADLKLLASLLGELMALDPEKRTPATEAIDHPWLRGSSDGNP